MLVYEKCLHGGSPWQQRNFPKLYDKNKYRRINDFQCFSRIWSLMNRNQKGLNWFPLKGAVTFELLQKVKCHVNVVISLTPPRAPEPALSSRGPQSPLELMMMMECDHGAVHGLCALLLIGGALFLFHQCARGPTRYGRYTKGTRTWTVPAPWGWFLQELPAFLVPALMACTADGSAHGRRLLLCTFTLHYLHRSLVYPFFVRGRPMPVLLVVFAAMFCLMNGFLQSHALLHCSPRGLDWDRVDSVRTTAGLGLFAFGMVMNIHSDHILRNLRRPGETAYRIPRGGLFELVSGANFLSEMVEWFGFAVAVWTLPAFSFAFFTACSIGPRALGHHRFYLETFPEYPRSRRALIPFIL